MAGLFGKISLQTRGMFTCENENAVAPLTLSKSVCVCGREGRGEFGGGVGVVGVPGGGVGGGGGVEGFGNEVLAAGRLRK